MKPLKSLLFCSSVAFVCLSAGAETIKNEPEKGTLTLNPKSGAAPLTVTITGPDEFLKPAKAHPPEYRLGCPYNIDWGDGKLPDFPPTRFDGKHTYDAPGTYKIRASLIRWNADDSTTVTWSATAEVKVGAPSKKQL